MVVGNRCRAEGYVDLSGHPVRSKAGFHKFIIAIYFQVTDVRRSPTVQFFAILVGNVLLQG